MGKDRCVVYFWKGVKKVLAPLASASKKQEEAVWGLLDDDDDDDSR